MSRRLTTKEFIQKARKVHGNRYDYDNVNYVNNHTKVEIICRTHGSFYQRPQDHLKGHGCSKCNGGVVRSTRDFIKRAKEIHDNKYDYHKVRYVNDSMKVEIICPKHGSFWQVPNSHLKGHGCPKCANDRMSKSKLVSFSDFLFRARHVHGDKYEYDCSTYEGVGKKLRIICPEHGEFWQIAKHHLNGHGCPKCGVEKLGKNARKTMLERYGVDHPSKLAPFFAKSLRVKRENRTFNTSKIQEELYQRLERQFGKSDVEEEYHDEIRYPFNCDFYIKSLDLFIKRKKYMGINIIIIRLIMLNHLRRFVSFVRFMESFGKHQISIF